MPTVDTVRAEWDASAPGWEEHERRLAAHTRPIEERIVDLVGVQHGEVVLELAGGLGGLSRELADHVGPEGKVIYTDLSEGMVDAARRRDPERENLFFDVMDAQDLDFDVEEIDAIVCKMGLMLMPDPSLALAECRRVLEPGGRLVAATWGSPEDNLWILTFGAAVLAHGHAPPGDPHEPGGIFSLSDPEVLRELLADAGFEDVDVETVDAPDRQPSFDDYWELRAATSGPLTAVLQQLGEQEVAQIRDTCEGYAEHLRAEDGSYVFPGQALVVVAR